MSIVNRKIIRPSTAEVDGNPRSRSAKLRVAQRIQPTGGAPTGVPTPADVPTMDV
jgi:hypothetical protein